MPALRLSPEQQIELAVDDLARLGSRTPQVDIVPEAGRVKLMALEGPGASAEVIAYESVDEGLVRQLLAGEARGPKIVVANRITRAAQSRLSEAGWSWYDRRHGARLVLGKHVFHLQPEPADTPPRTARVPSPDSDGPIRGRAGIAYAAALLCEPQEPPSLRSVAREIGMSPTSISNAARLLVDAGLVVDGAPARPDLFWALAAVWGPLKAAPIAAPPDPDSPSIRTNADRISEPGWALAGDVAALELGAPIVAIANQPSYWVPTQVALRRAERQYGPASWDDCAAVLLVPPTPLVTARRQPARSGDWPVPHVVFVALDLATDPSRGREILDQWTPEGVEPVWRG